jgi:hypothetical protein
MPAHYSPVTGVIRVYHDGKYTEPRAGFCGVCSVMWLDDTTAFLYAAHGNATRKIIKEGIKVLQAHGAKKIIVKREKTNKMPRPWQLIKSEELLNTWELKIIEAKNAE